MRIPTVHLNGTSKAELIRLNTEAAEAVHKAMVALAAAAPHGRDFYVQESTGVGSATPFERADIEHQDRVGKLQTVYEQLAAIVEGIESQGT